MFFHIADSTTQQNEFLIKGKIKAAAILFEATPFQTRECEVNSLLQSTLWLGLELEFCSNSLAWLLEKGKLNIVMQSIVPSLMI